MVEKAMRPLTEVSVMDFGNKADDGGDCAPLSRGCWANDGDRTEIIVKKNRWLRHDQVGLELIGGARGTIIRVDAFVEIRERKVTIGDDGCIACLVVPYLKVHDL